jgi:hypothetical protein
MSLFIRQSGLLVIIIALHQLSFAQETKLDTIVTQDYQKLVVPILEVTSTTITYQSQEEGPVTIPKAIVAYIGWGDGRKEELGKIRKTSLAQLGPLKKWNLEKIDTEQLQEFHSICKLKTRKFNNAGLVGLTTALVCPVAIVVIVKNSKSSGDFAQDFGTAIAATMFVGITFAGGTTLAAIGFSKGGNYVKKRLKLEEELGRRNQPLHSLRLSPGFNPVNQSGFLTLSMAF